jgi:hypothetical protein
MKPPIPVWSTLLLNCGLERWEVFRLSYLNQQAADCAFREAAHARDSAKKLWTEGLLRKSEILIKRAIRQERAGRQRSERAEQLRKLAAQIPYVDPHK